MNQVKKANQEASERSYGAFSRINGQHPFKDSVPGGRVEYKARYKKGGKVSFFNFALAKEMGLLPKGHEEKLNPELEKKFFAPSASSSSTNTISSTS